MSFLFLFLALCIGSATSTDVENEFKADDVLNKVQRQDFSRTIFIGDHYFKNWLCDSSEGSLRGSKSCIELYDFLRKPSNLKGECSDAASQWYCNTLFYKAFPKALNIGRSGWTIEEWIHTINNGDPLISQLSEMAYHDHIVIEVRGNLVHNSHQEKNMKESLENVEEVSRLLQKALPHCEVSIVSVLPQYREIDDAPQPENDFPYILMDRFANEILQASFYNLTSLYLP